MTYDRLVEFVDWKRFFLLRKEMRMGLALVELGLMWILQL